jgi:hypothetical protein
MMKIRLLLPPFHGLTATRSSFEIGNPQSANASTLVGNPQNLHRYLVRQLDFVTGRQGLHTIREYQNHLIAI